MEKTDEAEHRKLEARLRVIDKALERTELETLKLFKMLYRLKIELFRHFFPLQKVPDMVAARQLLLGKATAHPPTAAESPLEHEVYTKVLRELERETVDAMVKEEEKRRKMIRTVVINVDCCSSLAVFISILKTITHN